LDAQAARILDFCSQSVAGCICAYHASPAMPRRYWCMVWVTEAGGANLAASGAFA
jgi:hypothetical protein